MFIFLFTAASGVILAGILSSTYSLVTTQQPGFSMLTNKRATYVIVSILFLLFCGPVILVKNSYYGLRNLGYSHIAFILSLLIATYWSFITGLVLISALFGLFL